MLLEIACFEIHSAEIALNSVADRIEFCADGHLGGTTPNVDEFRYLRSKYQQPIYVMIRPKGGDFFYSNEEFETMKRSLTEFHDAGADGFVFGMLANGNRVDAERCKELINLAKGRPCTFHRAFDHTPDLGQAMQTIIRLGFRTVLTSGGKPSAVEGKDNLQHLVKNYSDSIDILVGGGVRSSNVAELRDFTMAEHFHSSAILPYEMFANEEEIKKLKAKLQS